MIPTHLIILTIVLGAAAIVLLILGVVGEILALTALALVLLHILGLILIVYQLEIGLLIFSIIWITAGFVELFDDDGLFGAILLWIIGIVLLLGYIHGCMGNSNIQPNCHQVTSPEGTLWTDPTMRCSKVDTNRACFVTRDVSRRDGLPTRFSICTRCGNRWMYHHPISELVTLEEYENEEDRHYREWKWMGYEL